ncbi:amylo-alpha-1,6-glucosidase [Heyndrickxia acidicola]|uniref:Amylo-alpha-1,6-glucosidase n=1 Tax=Heyndrickxia acidicola TaxID=209389 RepID=A0ABU6MAW9_9BACI|nr:amylo-alpha-1,6-glucosidase [Heyndrickxia acidicola]MED1201822.1 amylo-alpha-1,6-glucosidase [Heyndrickxia acidicola]
MDYRVIKENDLFLLTDSSGNIPENHPYGLGLYSKDTRFLSKLDVKINGEEPILLSSDASENYEANIILTNPHMEKEGELVLWRESVEIRRKRFIHDYVLYETITVKNYYPKPVEFDVNVLVDVDFADMFIIRGFQYGEIGNRTGQKVDRQQLSFHYVGADDVDRSTYIQWDRKEKRVDENGEIVFHFQLENGQEESVTMTIRPETGSGSRKEVLPKEEAMSRLKASYAEWEEKTASVRTDHPELQKLVDRGLADIKVLLTDIGHGSFPTAGLPWFGVPFGRDSLIAALQMLAFNPEIAKGTLKTLADKQGTEVNEWRDEQPGKIMHEIRFGELANTNQVPFTPYYGSIDSTPLFLMLLTEYVKWTGDLGIVEELRGNIDAALNWIDQYGDRDEDMFIEYHQESSKGIANQGWKDSGDSVVHRNGDYAKTPIALAEVQGYVYQAKMGIADIFETLGKAEAAKRLREQAQELKVKFHEAFWMEEHGFYAIALDQDKKQVGTITSNPGHILLSGMLEKENEKAVVETLVSPKMFSGYGIRTMGEGEAAYNPMSYHDGSIWPHDNSMILLGMSKAGYTDAASVVMNGLLEAAKGFEYNRLPELFCGYSDSLGKPIKYPVACSPQAWAAGTPLLMVQSLLGLYPDVLKKEITLSPTLLDSMNVLEVNHISIGEGFLSVSVTRNEGGLDVQVTENTTGYQVVSK